MENYLVFIGSGFLVVLIVAIHLMMRKALRNRDEKLAQVTARLDKRAQKRAAAVESVKMIEWEDAYAVDWGVIDNDHKTLFQLINKFNRNVPHFRSPEEMVPYIEALRKYTATHFKREEMLQEKVGYSFHEDHKQEHQALIEKLDALAQSALRANDDTITDAAVELGTFLAAWLTSHVIENDLPMRPYVDRMREHTKKLRALEE